MAVVVVTGASGGTGRAIARSFGARGDAVALLARGRAGLDGAADDVRSSGGKPLPLPVDVADPVAVADAAGRVEAEMGAIDTWVNVAMASVLAPFAQVEPAEFKRVTEVTYLGFVYGTKAALDRMRPRDKGTIVQVGSALGYRGIPLQSAYCGAKHAIRGFCESLRCELMHEGSGVRVTMVHLPAMNTPQFDWSLTRLPNHAQPLPPIYQPEVGARAVIYAADHPGRREFWVGGSTVGTIIANKVAGGVLDRYLARTGVKSQQTSQPKDPDAPANLWEPVDDRADFGAHGAFDSNSTSRSYQMWAGQHRGSVAAAAGGLTGLGLAGLAILRTRHR